jgi:hypothetical protein
VTPPPPSGRASRGHSSRSHGLASATLSTSAEGEFRTEAGTRIQVSTALDEGIALAAKLVDMMLYDVPNLRLGAVRVDVYSTFMSADGMPVQRPIITTTADRKTADSLAWEALTSERSRALRHPF